jgi:hypothetical protein
MIMGRSKRDTANLLDDDDPFVRKPRPGGLNLRVIAAKAEEEASERGKFREGMESAAHLREEAERQGC